MAAEFIEGARSSEGALLCEAAQYVGGARMSPIVVIVVVDADGNTLRAPMARKDAKRRSRFQGVGAAPCLQRGQCAHSASPGICRIKLSHASLMIASRQASGSSIQKT